MHETSDSPDAKDKLMSAMELFDLLLEAEDPVAVLTQEQDLEVRSQAQLLFRHHLLADNQEFLAEPATFEVTPVFDPGEVLLTRFEIDKLLGSGGMGEVYLAYDRALREHVAIKTIPRMLASSKWIRDQFITEVKNARRVTHDNVCRIYDLFENAGIPFFAMEHIDGIALNHLIADRELSRKSALELVLQLANGLDSAHRNGVVHGDFKPSNVLVIQSPSLRAVIMDFGLARALRLAGLTESLGAGTPGYMAPELTTGAPPSIASDIFAFGKVAQLLLPGEKLWDICTRPEPNTRLGSLQSVVKYLRRDKTRRYWIGSGILTMASTVLFVRSLTGTKFRLPEGARIFINGFIAASGVDPSIARLARGLFLTGVSQSSRIRALADEDVLPMLTQLSANAGLPASGSLLNKLLPQLGAHFWIDGEIRKVAERVSLVLRLFQLNVGNVIVQGEFRDLPSVAVASADGARWLREIAGESKASLDVDSPAAHQFTSSVPEALSKYYDAMSFYAVADMAQAIPPLQKAIQLDPNFAQAHCMLAQCYASFWRLEESFAEASHALRLATHLPGREKTRIETVYYTLEDDPIQMVDSSRRNLLYDPEEPRLLRSLARNLARAGRPDEGVRYLKQAVGLLPNSPLMRLELIEVLCEANAFEEALSYFEQRPDMAESDPRIYEGQAFALLGLERYDQALAASARVEEDMPRLAIAAHVLTGHFDIAESTLLAELARVEMNGSIVDRFETRLFLAGLYVLTDRVSVAESFLEESLSFPLVPMRCRYLEEAAFWASRMHNDSLLNRIASLVRDNFSHWPTPKARCADNYLTGLTANASEGSDLIASHLIAASGFPWSTWPLFDLAEHYFAQGKYDLADAYWQKFDSKRGVILSYYFPGALPLSWLRRAECNKHLGQPAISSQLARKVLDSWQRHNPNLGIVKAAQALLS